MSCGPGHGRRVPFFLVFLQCSMLDDYAFIATSSENPLEAESDREAPVFGLSVALSSPRLGTKLVLSNWTLLDASTYTFRLPNNGPEQSAR
jgi:hypothetical protein